MGRIALLLIAATLIFAAASSWLMLYPPVPKDLGGIESLDSKAEKVRIPVGQDDAIDGWLLPGSRSALIVIFHGYGREHTRAWRYAQFLQKGGYAILTVDFRSSRFWNRKPTTLGWYELNDARATLDWIAAQKRFAGWEIGLFGESLGGSVALVAASRHPEVRVVAVDGAFATGRRALEDASWRWAHLPPWPSAPLARALGRFVTKHDPYELDALTAASAIAERPTLVIHAKGDPRFSESQARDLWRAAGSDRDGLWILDERVKHNEGWMLHRAEYEERVLAFYRKHLHGEPVAWRQARDVGAMIGQGAAAVGRAIAEGAKKAGSAIGDAADRRTGK